MYIKTLTVSALTNYIKKLIDNDYILNNTSIQGEISNLKFHSSGHIYFTLKDEYSRISCIMFRSHASTLNFLPKDGTKVVVKGRVSVYEKDGSYQLYCTEMKLEGLGQLYVAFEELKAKLEKEGLFDVKYKRPIPRYPRRIGVITSPTGAAVRDIINVTKRRNPAMDILIFPSLVQGINASETLCQGIEALNKIEDIDVIILARGGGSIEELWSFNEENLAYAIFNSKKPVITGVGHETDFTIADFVSDRRAPTPSAAAEIATPSLREVNDRILNIKYSIGQYARAGVEYRHKQVELLRRTAELHNPMNFVINQYNYIDKLKSSISGKTTTKILLEKEKFNRIYSLLCSQNPLKILDKGYAIVEDKEKNIITSKDVLKNKNEVNIMFKDGKVEVKIIP